MKPDVGQDIGYLFPCLSEDSATPDSVVAIVCAAYADKYLGVLLNDSFSGANNKLKTKLFSAGGTLGTFGAKIDIATATNIIGPVTSNDLTVIARVRNRFAHKLEIDSFSHPNIVKLMDGFQMVGSIGRQMSVIQFQNALDKIENKTARLKFITNAATICLNLSSKYDSSEKQ